MSPAVHGAQSSPLPTIDLLLRLVDTHAASVLAQLQQHPSLASAADANGYTLLHAAASYSQLDLMRALVNTYHVQVDTTDADGETALFAAETPETVRCLVEELRADITVKNDEGIDAETNARTCDQEGDDGQWATVADYLAQRRTGGGVLPAATPATLTEGLRTPARLPDNVTITRMAEAEIGGEDAMPVDPEFRAKIEALAARQDFDSAQGQEELRNLVTEAVEGLAGDSDEPDRAVRRRIG